MQSSAPGTPLLSKEGSSNSYSDILELHPLIPTADIKEHIKNHIEQMPQITGPKAYSLAAPVVRDEPDIPDNNSLLSGAQVTA